MDDREHPRRGRDGPLEGGRLTQALEKLAGQDPDLAPLARRLVSRLQERSLGGDDREPLGAEAPALLVVDLLDGTRSERQVLTGLWRLLEVGDWSLATLGAELIELVREQLLSRPERSARIAAVARRLGDAHESLEGRALSIHARIFLANARRAALDLAQAREILAEVEELAEGYLLPWTMQGDRLMALYALRRDQRHLEAAMDCASQAAFAYEQAEREDLRLRAVLAMAIVSRRLGDFRAAAAMAQHVVDRTDPGEDRNLAFAARGNYALFLCDIGEFGPARGQLIRDRALWDSFENPAIQMRRRWLEGRIAAGFGESEEALEALREAFEGFQGLDLVLDAVLVSLDLAANLLDQERGDELVAHGEEVRAMGEGASGVLERTGEDLRGALEEYGAILVEGRFTFGTYWEMQVRFAGPRDLGPEAP